MCRPKRACFNWPPAKWPTSNYKVRNCSALSTLGFLNEVLRHNNYNRNNNNNNDHGNNNN